MSIDKISTKADGVGVEYSKKAFAEREQGDVVAVDSDGELYAFSGTGGSTHLVPEILEDEDVERAAVYTADSESPSENFVSEDELSDWRLSQDPSYVLDGSRLE